MSKRVFWEVSRHAAEQMLRRVVGVPQPTDEEIREAQAILWSFLGNAKPLNEPRANKGKHGQAASFLLPECDDHPSMRLRTVRVGGHRLVVTVLGLGR